MGRPPKDPEDVRFVMSLRLSHKERMRAMEIQNEGYKTLSDALRAPLSEEHTPQVTRKEFLELVGVVTRMCAALQRTPDEQRRADELKQDCDERKRECDESLAAIQVAAEEFRNARHRYEA